MGRVRKGWRRVGVGVALTGCLALVGASAPDGRVRAEQAAGTEAWRFAVSGDSRNCGEVVMPAIASGVVSSGAAFFWHLGDFRKVYDEDMAREQQRAGQSLTIRGYEDTVWDDFIRHQLAPFGSIPVMLAIGNHETSFPKRREDILAQFADYLTAPALREQRLKDNPDDHRVKFYYHWVTRGVDFITLDNATADQFDAAQLSWFKGVVTRDLADPSVLSIVVGMHQVLPDSLATTHTMNDSPVGERSGRIVYQALIDARDKGGKKIYLLASHSHFYIDGIFNTPDLKAAGRVLPGWIIGTGGAVRYALPANASWTNDARTNVYGYMLGEVAADGSVTFTFHEVSMKDVPPPVSQAYGNEFVRWCFEKNSQAAER